MSSEAGEFLALAKAKIAEGSVKADVATAWAAIGILEALLEAQRPVRAMRNPDAEWGDDPAGGMEMKPPAGPGEWDRWVSPFAARRIGELERQVELVARQRDEGTAGLTHQRDEARKWLEELGEDLASSDTQVHELQLQVATQADMIRTQREELRNLRAGAEA